MSNSQQQLQHMVQVLSDAGSSDPGKRNPAEEKIKNFEKSNLAGYLTLMCQVLANEKIPAEIRQLAGLNLKNTMVSKDEKQRAMLAQRWMALSEEVRAPIRRMALTILGANDKNARRTSALVVAKIASVELPRKGWPDLIDNLLRNVKQRQNENLRWASFDTLGYVCEESAESLIHKSEEVLSALQSGMNAEEKNDDIRYASTAALANCLEFVRRHMQNEKHRATIMKMIFDSVNCKNTNVRVAGYQCLVQLATSYYDLLGHYITPIFRLTANSIQNETEEVAMQAIEFWNAICDEELDRIEHNNKVLHKGRGQQKQVYKYVEKALESKLMNLLLMCCTKQTEEIDQKSISSRSQMAATCVGLISNTAAGAVIQYIMPFVKQHINSSNWHFKEAATLAFGALLDGPDPKDTKPLVLAVLAPILGQITDANAQVKDTAAWCLGRICQLCPDAINDKTLPAIMNTFVKGLHEAPHVATNICWAIQNLAENLPTDSAKTSPLSRYFQPLTQKLLEIAIRKDAAQNNLVVEAYSAINVLISTAAEDVFGFIVKPLIPALMARLNETLQGGGGEKKTDVQGLLCASILMSANKLPDQQVLGYANSWMTLLLKILNHGKGASVLEEAMSAIGAIAQRTKGEFWKYMQAFSPYLLKGLGAVQEQHLCIISTGVLIDVVRALEKKVLPYCNPIMTQLLTNLSSKEINRQVKPHVVSALADVALALGGDFEKYLKAAMQILISASQLSYDRAKNDEEDFKWLNALREAILEAYVGILSALSGSGKAQLYLQYLNAILAFLDFLAKDPMRDELVVKQACSLVGDLGSDFGARIKQVLLRPSVKLLIDEALKNDNDAVNKAGQWAKEQVDAIVAGH